MNTKYYVVYESIGNFSHMVYVSDNYYAIQDYLQDRFLNSNYDIDDPADEELFYSYFGIEEF